MEQMWGMSKPELNRLKGLMVSAGETQACVVASHSNQDVWVGNHMDALQRMIALEEKQAVNTVFTLI